MTAHRQSLDVARAWAECGGLTSADRYLVVNPFFHSFGYKAGILACLVSGATIVPQLVFDAGQAMALIEAERITVFPGPPTIYQTILDHPGRGARDLSSLRLAVTGAAVVPVALVERMRAELSFDTVLTAYGLTEAVVATMCRPGDDPQTVATRRAGRPPASRCGSAGPGRARRPPPGEPGEILLRGPNVMLGYLDDPAATRAGDRRRRLAAHRRHRPPGRGGYLTITDRLKDMYICGGFNVYPAEVEQVLARLDGVAESAVIGVPDGRLGEVGKAYVVTRPGLAPGRRRRAGVLPGAAGQLQGAPPGRVPRRPAPQPGRQAAQASCCERSPRDRAGRPTPRRRPVPVCYERRGAAAVVTLNRPRYRNAQNSVMTYALDAAFARAVNTTESRSSCWPARAITSAPATTSARRAGTSTSPSTARR